MLPAIALIVLAILIFASLIISSIAYRKQEKIRRTRQRVIKLRRQLHEVQDILDTLKRIDSDKYSLQYIVMFMLSLLDTTLSIKPEDEEAQQYQAVLNESLNQIKSGTFAENANRVLGSDRELRQAKDQLNAGSKLIRILQKKGKIPIQHCEAILARFRWLYLYIEVDSLVDHGDKSAEREDIASAVSYYKKAKQLLVQSSIDDPNKNSYIKEINQRAKGLFENNTKESKDQADKQALAQALSELNGLKNIKGITENSQPNNNQRDR